VFALCLHTPKKGNVYTGSWRVSGFVIRCDTQRMTAQNAMCAVLSNLSCGPSRRLRGEIRLVP
jgi:hypothetical protein